MRQMVKISAQQTQHEEAVAKLVTTKMQSIASYSSFLVSLSPEFLNYPMEREREVLPPNTHTNTEFPIGHPPSRRRLENLEQIIFDFEK